jgi:Ion channel
MATIGYGDFSPQCWLGKFLVICEIVIGLMFIVVILQGTISAVERAQPPDQDSSPPSSMA